MNSFELHQAHYLSTPVYTWYSVKRFTFIRLKLISDIGKHQFIESMIKGGISIIPKRYAKANNKFLKSYDPDKPISYIIYLDVYHLYGHSAMQLLTFEILDWVDPEKFNLDNYSDDGSIGCFLEIDLDYLDELNDLHNDYPLAAEKIKVIKKICCLNIN